MFADNIEHLFIPVGVCHPDIHNELAGRRHNVMLGSGMDYRDTHLNGTKLFRRFRKAITCKPLDIFQCFVNGIISLLAGRMTSLSMSRAIEYHEAALGYCELHQRRFPYDSKIQRPQIRYNQFQPIGTRNLLFGRRRDAKIVTKAFLWIKMQERRDKRQEASTSVITTEAEKFTISDIRRKGVTCVSRIGLHRIVMGIEQDGRLIGVKNLVVGPYVV